MTAIPENLFDEKSTATLEKELAQHQGKAKEILEKAEKESRSLTEGEQAEFDASMEVFRGCKQRLANRRAYIESQQQRAKPIEDLHKESDPGRRKEKPIAAITQIAAALVACGNDRTAGAAWVEERWGDTPAQKALSASVASAGGVLVPTESSNELIELLRPSTAVLSLGAQVLQLPYGSLVIPRQTGGATASFTGENSDVNASELTLEDLTLVAKEITALTPISNQLLRYGRMDAMSLVERDLIAGLSIRTDQAYIRDDGTSGKPRGLRYQCAAENVLVKSGTTSAQDVATQLGRLELALSEANVGFLSPGWMMAPRSYTFLNNLRDSNGNKVFPNLENRDNPTLLGWPVRRTTSIPKNLGGSGDESEIYLGDFADVVVGVGADAEIAISSEAAYLDSSGTMRAAFSRNQTLVRITAAVDIALRHAESVAVLTEVDWAP